MTENKKNRITIEHGAGGEVMDSLIKNSILKWSTEKQEGIGLNQLDDGAAIPHNNEHIVITTDSHIVRPLFFPGGDIGRLAVSGTINDLSVMGAEPLALTSALVIEEGLEIEVVEKTIQSLFKTAKEAGVNIVTGDTKVMESGEIDDIIINTTGIGYTKNPISDKGLKPGDKIIITGSIGNHGLAILSHREGFKFKSKLKSDVKPINHIIKKALKIGGVTAMKDPTRGGLAKSINEMAKKAKVDIELKEQKIPIKKEVKSTSEILGIDPMTVANEGIAIIAAKPEKADKILNQLRKLEGAKDTEIIGTVVEGNGEVTLETAIGGKRYIEPPAGDPIPRVC
ncbi:hydrogenase expression/formation protein HypE [Methanonatronarchaeum sp. AMET-Sl]|uniref:hydrogenase expression/formation protein HypE n=1 Tax=Methanonatronarchaeum sp. AMET-Sl TaxID=3037654 RepID=UPI00244E2F01|nr:hydrogenase expression/formation protein HypE [Methanonatronarchaeum sp. AMET-Sl]WGI17278.1 hydrogenase expression/formation protein HypE [Methanonatronarchaeum sp. AMET-Sl]